MKGGVTVSLASTVATLLAGWLMICAGIGVRVRHNGAMADRFPRKNDPASVAARREDQKEERAHLSSRMA